MQINCFSERRIALETGFAYFFDILTIVVIVSSIYMCGKQGFVKSIITLVGYSLAVIISVFAGNTLAPKIYDSSVKPEIISVVNEQLGSADVPYEITHALNNKYGKYGVKFEKSDVIDILGNNKDEAAQNIIDHVYEKAGFTITVEDADGIIGSIFEEKVTDSAREYLPAGITVNKISFDNEEAWNDAVSAITGGTVKLSEFIEKYFVRDFAVSIVRLLISILSFTLLTILMNVALRFVTIIDKLPIINAINAFLGGVMGAIQGSIIMYIIVLATKLIVTIGGDNMLVFNTETIGMTYIFKILYNLA